MTAGLLLAAGRSRRMEGTSKLLLPLAGKPLVRWAAEALVGAGLSPVVVVLGRDPDPVRRALAGLDLRFVENPRPEAGMGGSLAVGVGALGPEPDAVAVALGDMPRLSADLVRRVEGAFRATGRGIAVPARGGRRGHPVFFDLGRYRSALSALAGDQGARDILRAHADDVVEVPIDDPGAFLDVDTPDEYRRLTAGEAGRQSG